MITEGTRRVKTTTHKQNVWQVYIYYSQWHWAAFCCTSIKLLKRILLCTSLLPHSAPLLWADSRATTGTHREEITSCLITLIGKVTWQSWFSRQNVEKKAMFLCNNVSLEWGGHPFNTNEWNQHRWFNGWKRIDEFSSWTCLLKGQYSELLNCSQTSLAHLSISVNRQRKMKCRNIKLPLSNWVINCCIFSLFIDFTANNCTVQRKCVYVCENYLNIDFQCYVVKSDGIVNFLKDSILLTMH